MGKQTHTPGPWSIQTAKTGDTHSMIRAALPGYSGTCKIAEVTDIGSSADANARLIAAAPELLAALLAIDSQGKDASPNGDVAIPSEIWDLVQQAITKATAEQEA